MPIKVEGGTNNISIHQKFWNTLTKNSDSLALSQLWLCGFNIKQLTTVGKQIASKLDGYEQKSWSDDQTKVNATVLNLSNFDSVSKPSAGSIYMFTQGASFIADGINTTRLGSSHVGATKGLIGDSRLDLNATNITFLESNVSFVDGLLRPWSVLVGHRSLKDQLLRCDIQLFALEKWSLKEPLRVRKSMLFKNAVPINIDAEEYNYTGDKLIQRQVQFAFDRYEMKIYPDISRESTSTFSIIPEGYTAADQTEISKPIAPAIDLNNLTDLGTKQYYASVTSPATKKSLIDSVKNALGTAVATMASIQGKANDISSSVAQGLQAVGMNKAANQVSAANQNLQAKIIAPAANVIGTGQGAIGGAQAIGITLNKVSNSSIVGSYNSDQASQNAVKQTATPVVKGSNRSDQAVKNAVSQTPKTTPTTPDKGQDITLDING